MAASLSLKLFALAREYLISENKSIAGPNEIKAEFTLEDGTSAGQIDLVFSDRRTLSVGNEVLDLAGTLTDSFGNTITFAKVMMVLIKNRSTTDGDDLEVGPDATNGWAGAFADASDRVVVAAGRTADEPGLFLWFDPRGQAVSAGSTDELYIENVGANDVDYDILIVGTSA